MVEHPQAIASPPVDLTEMKKTVGGKMEVIQVLVNHILGEYPEKLRQIRQGAEDGDAEMVRVIAHTLKSSFASFGAAEAREVANALELSGATGELGGAGKMLPRLEQEIQRIVDFFSDSGWQEKV